MLSILYCFWVIRDEVELNLSIHTLLLLMTYSWGWIDGWQLRSMVAHSQGWPVIPSTQKKFRMLCNFSHRGPDKIFCSPLVPDMHFVCTVARLIAWHFNSFKIPHTWRKQFLQSGMCVCLSFAYHLNIWWPKRPEEASDLLELEIK